MKRKVKYEIYINGECYGEFKSREKAELELEAFLYLTPDTDKIHSYEIKEKEVK